MSKLHIFIDGTWLYRAASPDLVLASKTATPDHAVWIDFDRFDSTLLNHIRAHGSACSELGDRYISTSIFTLPSDFDSWPDRYEGLLPQHVEQTKRNLHARSRFVQWAIDAGYSDSAIYRPSIKRWIVQKLIDKTYQEKQVDTTVVALLVRSPSLTAMITTASLRATRTSCLPYVLPTLSIRRMSSSPPHIRTSCWPSTDRRHSRSPASIFGFHQLTCRTMSPAS